MINKRKILLSASVWELLRFFLLFITVIVANISIIRANRQSIFWLIILCSGSLIMPAGFLLLYYDEIKYGILLNLLRLGKVLGLFSSLLLMLMEPIGPVLQVVKLVFLPFPVTPVVLLLFIIFFDLIFLGLLLSYRMKRQEPEVSRSADLDSLPDFKETKVHDL